MPFTLIGYSESQDSAVLTNIAALADQHVNVSGDDVIVPKLSLLLGYYFNGVNFTQGQISSPSLRRRTLVDVEPADLNAEPLSPASFHDLWDSPVALVPNEALNTLMAEDAAGASRVNALIWLGDGTDAPIEAKDVFTVRATGTTTLVANAWTAVPLTLSQSLPAGRYQLVGLRGQAAGLIAARVVFIGGIWRPGVIGFDTDGDLDVPRFRTGNAGVFGEFQHNILPQIECLSVSADTAEVFHLDLLGPL